MMLRLFCLFACFKLIWSFYNYPNIILLVADDLGWDDVSFHGSTQIATPNIDGLAADGIILNNYYVAAVCTPSRGALLSGYHPIHTGTQHSVILTEEPRGFPLNIKLLSQYLKEYDYATHIVGKWHLGFHKKVYTPTFRGFDSHIGYWSGSGDYYDHTAESKSAWGIDFRHNLDLNKEAIGVYSTDYFTQQALNLIEAHNQSKPFFLYMAYQSVHSANSYAKLQAPRKYIDMFPNIQDYRRRTFAGMLYSMDDSIGQLIELLSEKNMLGNSIIVFTSDNGGPAGGFNGNVASNWPLRGVKASLWEGGVRVPAFIWSPLLKKSGYVSNALMHVSDWVPTILTAINADKDVLDENPKMYGMSMWKTLSNNRTSPRKELLYNIDPFHNVSAIRVKNWKLIQGLVWPKWSGWIPRIGENEDNSLKYSSKVKTVLNKLHRGQKKSKIDYNFVNCGPKPENASTNCKPNIKPCLFNLEVDPCEYNNVADQYPEVFQMLWQKILLWNATAVINIKSLDPRSYPQYYGYAWSPWCDIVDCDS